MKFKIFGQWICALGLFSASTGHAEGKAKFVTGSDYAPYADEALPGGGLFTEIVRQVYKRIDGVEPAFDFKSWKRGYEDAKRGSDYLATFPYVKLPEREAEFLYSAPVHKISVRYFVKEEDKSSYDKVEDLRGKWICTPFAYNLEDAIKKAFDDGIVKLDRPHTMGKCMNLLNKGRIDAVVAAEDVGWMELEKALGTRKGFKAVGSVSEQELHVIFSKKRPDAREQVEKFNAMLKSLNIGDIAGQYFAALKNGK